MRDSGYRRWGQTGDVWCKAGPLSVKAGNVCAGRSSDGFRSEGRHPDGLEGGPIAGCSLASPMRDRCESSLCCGTRSGWLWGRTSPYPLQGPSFDRQPCDLSRQRSVLCQAQARRIPQGGCGSDESLRQPRRGNVIATLLTNVGGSWVGLKANILIRCPSIDRHVRLNVKITTRLSCDIRRAIPAFHGKILPREPTRRVQRGTNIRYRGERRGVTWLAWMWTR
jgi:hypothetical protein